MAKRGAKGKYHEWLTYEGLTRIKGWAMDGLSNNQIAHNMGISEQTFYNWTKKYVEFFEAIKKNKEIADREVENAMYKAAQGYFVEETKTIIEKDTNGKDKKRVEKTKKWVVSNPAMNIFWLKNRKPSKWRDKPFETIIEDITQKLMENWKVNTTGNVEKELFNDMEKYDDDDDETDE